MIMLQYTDRMLFYFTNHCLSNPFFDRIMPFMSSLGDGPLLFAASFILIFFKKRELKALGLSLLAGLTISYYAVSVLKALVARPRPSLVLPDVILLVQEKSMSFPSNHAAVAFMAAVLLSAHFKKYSVVFYLFAAAIAVSRVYMGVHYPSDVLVGGIIGTLIGFLLIKIVKIGDVSL